MALISIIVPVLNEGEILEQTLKKLKLQKFRDFELIVVDNGSTDESVEIAKKYADKVLFESKKGSINAMKKGFENADGEIILACDADSVYDENYLEKIVSTFQKTKNIVALYGPFVFVEKGPIFNFFIWVSYVILDFLSRIFTKTYIVGAANFAIKKSAYFEVGGYTAQENLASQDFRLAKRLSKLGKVKFLPLLIVRTSYRRYEKAGMIKGFFQSLKFWADVAFNKNKLTYEDYYTKDYYREKERKNGK
ncbi:glycosyltransferase [Thermosipho ferrireducens]|uniref:Glycosyltransferase n=1 Tax=Thermosipho ferrireducens TaxID=2571116 RepID=A0ABX7SAB5_9BACT|nr:glycosyltransferase [Thermosipho ferrireducens]QTA38845.1 glycosyltransferase [Thermosipho ferrireducens]